MIVHRCSQGMTEVQQQKMKQVADILLEHFNSHVIVVSVVNGEDTSETYHIGFAGGPAKALGLLGVGQSHVHRMINFPA